MSTTFEATPEAMREAARLLRERAAHVRSHGDTLRSRTTTNVGKRGPVAVLVNKFVKDGLRITGEDTSAVVASFYDDVARALERGADRTAHHDADAGTMFNGMSRHGHDEHTGGLRTVADGHRPAAGDPVDGIPGGRGGSSTLPEGSYVDRYGKLHGPDGKYVSHPALPAPEHTRDTEYPGGYRQSTHDAMAARWTEQGREQGGVPVDSNGNRIPHDQLTWYDRRGREIEPADQVTYDHNPPVVDHWNSEGSRTSRAARHDWYNDPDHLAPMHKSQNSRQGGQMLQRYVQVVGPGYTP